MRALKTDRQSLGQWGRNIGVEPGRIVSAKGTEVESEQSRDRSLDL